LLKKQFTDNSKIDKTTNNTNEEVNCSTGKDKQPAIPHILIVSHSGLIQELLTHILATTTLDSNDEVSSQTIYRHSLLHTGLFTFYFRDPTHMIILRKNDVMHLKGLKKKFKNSMKRNMVKSPKNRLNRSSEIGPPALHSQIKPIASTGITTAIPCTTIIINSASQKSRSGSNEQIEGGIRDTTCCSTDHL